MNLTPKGVRQMMPSRRVTIATFTTVICVVASAALAQQSKGGRPEGAPPEALAACENKSVGDACSMTLRGKGDKVSGQCTSTPDNKVACLPEGAPRPPKS